MQVTRATFLPLLTSAEPHRLGDHTLWDDYSGDLAVIYSFGPPFGKRVVTHTDLEQMQLSPRALRRTALDHLESLASRAQFHGQAPTLMLSFDGLESSLLLATEFWTRLQGRVPGDLVVGVPARDVVIVTGSHSRPGLEKARRAVDRVFFAGGDHLLSRKLLIRQGGMWEPFEGPARQGGRAALHHGPDQRPRQYQEHPSWPSERVPVTPRRPARRPLRTGPALAPAASAAQAPMPPIPSGPSGGPAPLGPAVPPMSPAAPLAAISPMASRSPAPMPAMGPLSPTASVSPAPPAGPQPLAGPSGSTTPPTGPPLAPPEPVGLPGQHRSAELPGRPQAPIPLARPADPAPARPSGYPARSGDGPGDVLPYSAVPYSAVPYSAVPYSAVPYSAVPSSSVPYSAVPYSAIPRSPMGYSRGARSAFQQQAYRSSRPDYAQGDPETNATATGHRPSAAHGSVPAPVPPAYAPPPEYSPQSVARPFSAPPASRPYSDRTGYSSPTSGAASYGASAYGPADSRWPAYPGSWGSAPDTPATRPGWDVRTGARARFSR